MHVRLKQIALKLALKLAKAELVFYLMPALIILLIIGTITQAEIGLYAAHQKYFASFIIWLGPIPLPGGYTILGLLTLNLTIKFLFFSEWSWKKSGIILSHLGALILLIGGLLTAITASEKYMLIPEGEETPYIYDYHQRKLMIYQDDVLRYELPFEKIIDDRALPLILPFEITVTDICENCDIVRREETPDYDPHHIAYQSMAQFMALTPKPSDKNPEANMSGVTFDIFGCKFPRQNGTYIAFEGMPKPIEITAPNGQEYKIILGKQQTELPFSIRLDDFQKETYAGVDLAKSYASEIVILDNGTEWPTRIEMNKPLRYKGYTFFQSSFEQTPELEITILSVVKNQGWLFPYIGTGVLALGLLLHSVLVIRRRKES